MSYLGYMYLIALPICIIFLCLSLVGLKILLWLPRWRW